MFYPRAHVAGEDDLRRPKEVPVGRSDRHEHLVRYLGWYSNRARGERARALKAHQPAKTPPAAEAAVSEFDTRAKAARVGKGS